VLLPHAVADVDPSPVSANRGTFPCTHGAAERGTDAIAVHAASAVECIND
jgi:hypothetical protein